MSGQPDVEEHRGRAQGAHGRQRGCPVGGHVDAEPGPAEVQPDEGGDGRLVLDHEHQPVRVPVAPHPRHCSERRSRRGHRTVRIVFGRGRPVRGPRHVRVHPLSSSRDTRRSVLDSMAPFTHVRTIPEGPSLTPSAPQIRSLDWITRLVSLDTTSRNPNLELIDLVAAEMRRHGLSPEILPNEDGTKANLLATIAAADGSTHGGVVLSGHTDVVPVDGQDWHSEPFTPEIRDGRLYGRGTADMKSFIGVVVSALPELVAARLTEPVHIALSYDEEVGCGGGAQLAKDISARGLSPADVHRRRADEHAGHRGPQVDQPAAGHRPRPGRALLPDAAGRQRDRVRLAASSCSSARSPTSFKAKGPYDEAYVVPFTTASVNLVDGGIAGNTVADLCTVQMEFRSIAEVDPQEVLGRIRAYCEELQEEMRSEHPSAGIDLEVLAMVPGWTRRRRARRWPSARCSAARRRRTRSPTGPRRGSSRRRASRPSCADPATSQQAHAPDEFIEVDQILACEALVDRLVQHLTVRRHERSHPVSTSTTSTLDVSTEERSRVRRAVVASLRRQRPRVVRHHRLRLVRRRHQQAVLPDRSPAPRA